MSIYASFSPPFTPGSGTRGEHDHRAHQKATVPLFCQPSALARLREPSRGQVRLFTPSPPPPPTARLLDPHRYRESRRAPGLDSECFVALLTRFRTFDSLLLLFNTIFRRRRVKSKEEHARTPKIRPAVGLVLEGTQHFPNFCIISRSDGY